MNDAQRNLMWKLSWYRHSELEGALLLGRVVRAASDAAMIRSLMRHCADEARHAFLWSETIASLQLPTVRIFRSYQSFYAQGGALPATLTEVLILTHVFERRVDHRFRQELLDPRLPAPAARTFRRLIQDERDHLNWIARWLAERPETQPLLRRYEAIDREVYERLLPFDHCIWDVPGLGEEIGESAPWPDGKSRQVVMRSAV